MDNKPYRISVQHDDSSNSNTEDDDPISRIEKLIASNDEQLLLTEKGVRQNKPRKMARRNSCDVGQVLKFSQDFRNTMQGGENLSEIPPNVSKQLDRSALNYLTQIQFNNKQRERRSSVISVQSTGSELSSYSKSAKIDENVRAGSSFSLSASSGPSLGPSSGQSSGLSSGLGSSVGSSVGSGLNLGTSSGLTSGKTPWRYKERIMQLGYIPDKFNSSTDKNNWGDKLGSIVSKNLIDPRTDPTYQKVLTQKVRTKQELDAANILARMTADVMHKPMVSMNSLMNSSPTMAPPMMIPKKSLASSLSLPSSLLHQVQNPHVANAQFLNPGIQLSSSQISSSQISSSQISSSKNNIGHNSQVNPQTLIFSPNFTPNTSQINTTSSQIGSTTIDITQLESINTINRLTRQLNSIQQQNNNAGNYLLAVDSKVQLALLNDQNKLIQQHLLNSYLPINSQLLPTSSFSSNLQANLPPNMSTNSIPKITIPNLQSFPIITSLNTSLQTSLSSSLNASVNTSLNTSLNSTHDIGYNNFKINNFIHNSSNNVAINETVGLLKSAVNHQQIVGFRHPYTDDMLDKPPDTPFIDVEASSDDENDAESQAKQSTNLGQNILLQTNLNEKTKNEKIQNDKTKNEKAQIQQIHQTQSSINKCFSHASKLPLTPQNSVPSAIATTRKPKRPRRTNSAPPFYKPVELYTTILYSQIMFKEYTQYSEQLKNRSISQKNIKHDEHSKSSSLESVLARISKESGRKNSSLENSNIQTKNSEEQKRVENFGTSVSLQVQSQADSMTQSGSVQNYVTQASCGVNSDDKVNLVSVQMMKPVDDEVDCVNVEANSSDDGSDVDVEEGENDNSKLLSSTTNRDDILEPLLVSLSSKVNRFSIANLKKSSHNQTNIQDFINQNQNLQPCHTLHNILQSTPTTQSPSFKLPTSHFKPLICNSPSNKNNNKNLETELYLLRTNSDNILQNSSKLPSTSSSSNLSTSTSPSNLTSLFLDKSNRIATSNYHSIATTISHGSHVAIGGKHKLARSDSPPPTPAKKTKLLSAETAALLSKNQVNCPQTSLSAFFDQEQDNKVELKQASEEQTIARLKKIMFLCNKFVFFYYFYILFSSYFLNLASRFPQAHLAQI